MKTVKRIHGFFVDILERLTWVAALLTRFAVGWIFFWAGWGKLHNIDRVTAFFQSLGIPYPQLNAGLVGGLELICGGLLILGLGTRYAAIPLIGIMKVALVTAKKEEITTLIGLFGLSEFLYIVLLFWLMVYGAGPIALDRFFRKK